MRTIPGAGWYSKLARRAAAGVLLAAVLGLAPATAASAATPDPSQGTLTASATSVTNGASITFSYSIPPATVSPTNWIGIYKAGQTPGQVASTTWQYAPGAGGTLTFSASSLSGVGHWTAWYLYNNAYQPLAASVSFTVVPSRPAPAPVFRGAIGGTGQGALSGPSGVAAAPGGDIWAADTGHNRVSGFAPSGELVTTFGAAGKAALSRPRGVAVDAGNHVWVADTGHDRVVEFSSSGAELASFGRAGSGPGQLASTEAVGDPAGARSREPGGRPVKWFASVPGRPAAG